MAVQENIIDFNKICRLCLTEESVMSSIYSDQDRHSSAVPLPLRIMACVSIELNSVDGLPSQICTTCLCQVDGWYKFKDLCETADAVLKKCIKNEPVQLETISQIRSRAQEVRQFFASPHLVKVEGLESALNQSKLIKKPMETAVNNEDGTATIPASFTQKYFVYVNADVYFKWLQTEYKLNEKITVKEITKRGDNAYVPAHYEIAFDSPLEKPEKGFRNERLVMEVGDCQILEVSSLDDSSEGQNMGKIDAESVEGCSMEADEVDVTCSMTDDRDCDSPLEKLRESGEQEDEFEYRNPEIKEVVANYEKTKKYLENVLRERGNTHEEVIENVLYSFRLDEEGKLDVVNIMEGVCETYPLRGFRYSCLFCSKIVVNKIVYDRHIRESHLNCLVCKVCDKQLHSLRNFLIHTKTHLGVYTFTCPLCGKGLTRASIFKSHMMYHYYGKVQKCQICEKKFRDVFALRRHVQLHDKKIEYICELCGFGTHLKSNLEYHVRAHGDERSFMCELCGKLFTASQSLQLHMKTHEPNFPCPHCKRVYRHEDKFRNHLEQSHGELVNANEDEEMDVDGEKEREQEENNNS